MGVQNIPDIIIDHINRNPEDNRKENLRFCDYSQNGQNHNMQESNTSGVIGISWHIRINKYSAFIMIDKKLKHLGYFENKEDAIKTRLQAEFQYYGDFAPQRHLFEQYGVA
jgi:hypothetical protein